MLVFRDITAHSAAAAAELGRSPAQDFAEGAMIYTYPDLHRVLWQCVGHFRNEAGAIGDFRRVAEGFVWEFRWPSPQKSAEIALLGDGSFVLLEQNPQVHWHKVIDCRIELEAFEAVYQSEWSADWRVALALRGGRELEYRREIGPGRVFRFVLQRAASTPETLNCGEPVAAPDRPRD